MARSQPFLVAFGAGTAAIVVVRLVSPSLAGATISVVIAVAAVAALGVYSRHHALEPHQAGDDLYHLGLLFTLLSLILALIQLFIMKSTEDLTARTNQLIGNFGIALFSTVAGILGRILMQTGLGAPPQARTTGNQPEPKTEPQPSTDGAAVVAIGAEIDELSDSMRALRGDLREARDAFAHFTRVTLAQGEQTKTHTERLMVEFNEHIARVADAGLNDTSTTWRDMAMEMQRQAKAGLADTSETWREMALSMRRQAQGLVERMDTTVENVAVRAETALRDLAEQAEFASATAKSRVEAAKAEIDTVMTRLVAVNDILPSLAASLDATKGSVVALGGTAATVASGLDARAAEVLTAHETLAESARKYQEDGLDAHRRAVEEFMAAAKEQLRTAGENWRAAIEQLDRAIKKQQQVGELNIEATERLTGLMSREVQGWLDFAEPLRLALDDVVGRLATAIRQK